MKTTSIIITICLLFASSARATEPDQKKPVIVFVHGAWGGGWQFKKVQPLLEARGYEVWRPTLTGLGERSHLAHAELGLDTHIEDIVNFLRFENLTNVILLGHSYGGMVVTGVADRVPERIKHLIYLDALLPADGESAFDTRGARPGPSLEKMAKDGFLIPSWVKPDKPYPRDVPHPLKTFLDPISLKNPAARAIPATYILTVDPGKSAEQDDFYSQSLRAKESGQEVLQLEGDHNPQWFRPEATVEILSRIR
jgi:pimeloyl-ACP methyl ester carboxylesterase